MDDSKNVSKITIILIVLIVVLVAIFVLWKIGFFNNIFKVHEKVDSSLSNDIIMGSSNVDGLKEGEIQNIEGENNIQIGDDGKKVNNGAITNNEYYLDEIIFYNFEISSIDGKTKISYNIQNSGDELVKLDGYNMFFYDENNKCVGYKLIKGKRLASGEEIQVDVIVDADIANVSNISLKREFFSNK